MYVKHHCLKLYDWDLKKAFYTWLPCFFKLIIVDTSLL